MPFINGGHFWLILILLVIVLIIWGPGKLPDVGSGLGRAIKEFRKATTDQHDPPPPTPTPTPAPPPAAEPPKPAISEADQAAPPAAGTTDESRVEQKAPR